MTLNPMNPITPTQQALGLTEALRQRFLDHPALGLEVWEKFAANVEGPANYLGIAEHNPERPLHKIVSYAFMWYHANEGFNFWDDLHHSLTYPKEA